MEKNKLTLADVLEELNKICPLVPHTRAGRLYSTVRRMKAEKELQIPIPHRTGFAISVQTGKSGREMEIEEWEKFYRDLRDELKRDYPDLYKRLYLLDK